VIITPLSPFSPLLRDIKEINRGEIRGVRGVRGVRGERFHTLASFINDPAFNEAELHGWLRAVWHHEPIARYEPTRGTTIGHPDVELLVPIYVAAQNNLIAAQSVPVPMPFKLELKVWQRTQKGINVKIRPSQYRWHIVSSKEGFMTGLLAAIRSGDAIDVFLIPGSAVQSLGHYAQPAAPKMGSDWAVWGWYHLGYHNHIEARERLTMALQAIVREGLASYAHRIAATAALGSG